MPTLGEQSTSFRGFEPLTGNFVYCPNQFFDICLPFYSRGTVRLVAYLLRQTLGWLDKNGDPITQEVSCSYRELVSRAGISRGSIGRVLDEAIGGGFIVRTKLGQAKATGQPGQAAFFMLRWDMDGGYAKDPDAFNGFFGGEGHRCPTPNAFFDRLVPRETQAVVKVVGTVLRHTVGYQNHFGNRRESAPLSYSYIQRYAHMPHRTTLSIALKQAVARGYVECVEHGTFDPTGRNNLAARYGVRWLDNATSGEKRSKIAPALNAFKNRTGIGSETVPVDGSKNLTHRKTKPKDINKHKQRAAVVLLQQEGFSVQDANKLAAGRSYKEIEQQIRWLEKRNRAKNRLGMLRRAIEGDWSAPAGVVGTEQQEKTQNHDRKQQQERSTLR